MLSIWLVITFSKDFLILYHKSVLKSVFSLCSCGFPDPLPQKLNKLCCMVGSELWRGLHRTRLLTPAQSPFHWTPGTGTADTADTAVHSCSYGPRISLSGVLVVCEVWRWAQRYYSEHSYEVSLFPYVSACQQASYYINHVHTSHH